MRTDLRKQSCCRIGRIGSPPTTTSGPTHLGQRILDIAAEPVVQQDRRIDVVRNTSPTVLLGLSEQQGAFDEDVVQAMAERVDRPIILPLSNLEQNCEATPADVMQWTDGKGLIGTGSPFDPVEVDGEKYTVAQTNNAYVFPGMRLGILAVKAHRASDGMFAAAARALGESFDVNEEGPGQLLPPTSQLRKVARTIAAAVAHQARDEGLCDSFEDEALDDMIDRQIWKAESRRYQVR